MSNAKKQIAESLRKKAEGACSAAQYFARHGLQTKAAEMAEKMRVYLELAQVAEKMEI